MNTIIDQLTKWLAASPPGVLVPAASLAEYLTRASQGTSATQSTPAESGPPTWRERLWTCHPDVRIGVRELGEALDRPESWVYRHTSPKSGLPLLPHRKFDSQLVFVVGEIRTWIHENEAVIVAAAQHFSSRNPHARNEH